MEDDDAFLYGDGDGDGNTAAADASAAPGANGAAKAVDAQVESQKVTAPAAADLAGKGDAPTAADAEEQEEGEADEDDDDDDAEEGEEGEDEESDDDLEIITEAPLDGAGSAAAAAYSRARQPRMSGGPIPRQMSNANLVSGGLTSEYTPLTRSKPLPDSPANAAHQGTPSAAAQQQQAGPSLPASLPVTSLGLLGAKLEPQYGAFKDLGAEVAPGLAPSTAPRLDLSPKRHALHIDPMTGLTTAIDGDPNADAEDRDEDEAEGPLLYEVDPSAYGDKPWRRAGADLTDYFNYGFNEESWRLYMERKRTLMKTREELLREREEEHERERVRAQEAAEAAASARAAAAAQAEEDRKRKVEEEAAAAAKEAQDEIPNHDQLLRQLMNMLVPGMPPQQQMAMLQQMGVANHNGRLVAQMLQMMGLYPGPGGPGMGGPPVSGMGPNPAMMGMAPQSLPPISMGMGMGMGMGPMGQGPPPNSIAGVPGGPRADRRIPSGPGQGGLPNRPPPPGSSIPTGPRMASGPGEGGSAPDEEGSKSGDRDDPANGWASSDSTPLPTGPAIQVAGRAARNASGRGGRGGIPTGPSGGNGRAPPTGPAADRNRGGPGPANAGLPPNVPTGPRAGSGKSRRYNDRDTGAGASDSLDYGAGGSGSARREERETSSPPARSTTGGRDDDEGSVVSTRRSSRRRGGGSVRGRSPEDERGGRGGDRERERDRDRDQRERDRDDRERREGSGYRARGERDRSVSVDGRRESNGAETSREKARAERRAGKGDTGAGSGSGNKRGREDDDDVASPTSTRRRR